MLFLDSLGYFQALNCKKRSGRMHEHLVAKDHEGVRSGKGVHSPVGEGSG